MIEVVKLREDAILPTRSHKFDAGADLYLPKNHPPVDISPGESTTVSTGIAVNIPPGYVGLVHPRSGLAFRYNVSIVNAPGTIDSGYTGEIKVRLVNLTRPMPWGELRLHGGDRIAQLVIQTVALPDFYEVESLENTERGDKGFGSTGA